mgnify:CR=1 FL=1
MPHDTRSDRYTVASGLGTGLVEFAAQMGLDLIPQCRRLGIDPKIFESMMERVSLSSFCALLEYCARQTGDDAFGLRFGLKYKPGSTGPFGYGLMAAPTLEQFLRFQNEHMQFSTQTSYSKLEFTPEAATFSWALSPVIAERDQFVDLGVTIIIRHLRHLFGPATAAVRVALQRKAPPDVKAFREALGHGVEFEHRLNCLIVPSELLKLNNHQADPRLFKLMDLQCRQLRPSNSDLANFETEMEDFILSRIAEDTITLASAARYFSTSERSLQRRLAELDTNLNDLRDKLRRSLAAHLIENTNLSATEISYRLGYSAPSAFTRSFQRWFGTSPKLFRGQASNKAASYSNKPVSH